MARIAILNAGHMDYGGTERVVANQANGLYMRGHDVTIFTPINDRNIYTDVIPSRVQTKPWWHTLPAPILKRTINRLLHFWLGGGELKKFDVLIAHNQPGPYAAYKNKKKNDIPYIVYLHAPWRRLYPREVDLTSGWASDYRERLMFIRQGYWRRIDLASIQNANAHLANSCKIVTEVKQVYNVDAKLCLPGIDLTKYRDFSKIGSEKLVEKYHVTEHTLLVVGRHAPQKRLEWLPEIVKKISNRDSKVEVVVTGKPNNLVTPKLTNEARKQGVQDKIRMVGAVPDDDLIALYHSCPILIYNAVYEDFGLPPIEAMACGCVPVAWNEGAGPCETIIDGKTGLLAKPYELSDFAEKVNYLLENPSQRASMSSQGMANAVKYDWSVHIDILDETIRKVMG